MFSVEVDRMTLIFDSCEVDFKVTIVYRPLTQQPGKHRK